MKRKSIVIVFGIFLFFGLLASNLFAQDKPIAPDKPAVQEQPIVQEQTRVIEEALVLSDPTVAQPKKWLIGATGEWWYIRGTYTRTYNDGTVYSRGDINGSMPGGTITLGYDAFTLAYSYRKGSWDIDSTFASVSGASSVMTQDQAEHEITARWLFRLHPHFNPYVMVGYNQTIRKDTETLDAGHIWSYNSNRVSIVDRTYKSPLIGLGAIVPFNKYIGLRADGRLIYSWADWKRDDGSTMTGSGVGGALVGTLYWNIWEGLNLQIGGKYQYLNGGSDIGYSAKLGAFGMLGYTYKF